MLITSISRNNIQQRNALIISVKINRPNLIALFLAGMLVFLVSGAAFGISGEPLPFDQYTVSNGEITASCGNWTNANGDTLNVTCSAPTISDGMMQREVSVLSLDPDYNGTYIQFVLVESGASGDGTASPFSTARGNLYFTNEDFIKMNNRGEGLASKLSIQDSKFDNATFVEDRFEFESVYKIGWAQGVGITDPWIDMNQSLSELQYNNTQALATSAYELYNDNIDIQSVGPALNNTEVYIDQRLLLQDDKNSDDDAVQKFKNTRLTGMFNDSATDQLLSPPTPDIYIEFDGTTWAYVGSCVVSPTCYMLPGSPGITNNQNPLLIGGTNGGNINWQQFDEISATWIGVEAVNPLATTISRLFGFTKYENKSSPTNNFTSLTSLTSPEAGGSLGAWNSIYSIYSGLPLFGQAEAMADTAIVSMTDFSVMDSSPPLGAANLDYIAYSDPTLIAMPNSLTIAETDYNLWTLENGVFNASCPAFADACSDVVINENGLYQRLITVAGEQYVQTILADDTNKAGVLDPAAPDYAANSLAFKMETFVKLGAGSGIASNMHLAERGTDTAYLVAGMTTDMPNTAGDFTNDVTMNIGWANQGTIFVGRDMNGDGTIDIGEGIIEPHAAIDIKQGLVVQDSIQTDAVSMEEAFTLERGATQTDKRMSISNRIGTQIGFVNPIKFKSVTVSGAYQRTARTDIADPFILPGNSSDISWSAGDALQATWLAGQYGTNPLVPVTQFGSTSLANRTTGERISYTNIETLPVTPDNWLIDPFLTAPTYP